MEYGIRNPYACEGRWFKGNLHTHTTNSDGGMTPAEVADFYESQGYDFLAVTDHAVLTDMSGFSKPGFLTIPSMELHSPHMVGLNLSETIVWEEGLQNEINAISEQGGLPIIAHPYWMGLQVSEVASAHGYLGIEIYNFICQSLNGKGHALVYWDEALAAGQKVWGFAVDDAHLSPTYPGGAKGWIMAKATRLTVEELLAAMQSGAFYSSNGPSISDIEVSDGEIWVRCSPVQRIHFVAQAYYGSVVVAPESQTLTEATYSVAGHETYVRIECVDLYGRTAWSNPLFVESYIPPR